MNLKEKLIALFKIYTHEINAEYLADASIAAVAEAVEGMPLPGNPYNEDSRDEYEAIRADGFHEGLEAERTNIVEQLKGRL